MDISKNQWRSTRGEGPLSIRRIKTLTRSLIWTSNDRNIPGSKKIMFQNLGGWRSRFSYRKLAAQEGPNSRLSSSFSFFSFWLIKAWCTSNLISNLAVCIDELTQLYLKNMWAINWNWTFMGLYKIHPYIPL